MGALCRDCGWRTETTSSAPERCPSCRGRRIAADPALFDLTVAHVDCDAFYASVEKRDDPTLSAKPVIVGGGRRGVVSAACYVARSFGVRSAMPMFKALALCPTAEVRKPRMSAYVAASREIRSKFLALTPLVEPLSLDEAFLDLAGTQAVHSGAAAELLSNLAREVERDVGVSISIGLAANKFLAKLASDLDKPRGFAVVSQARAPELLAPMPVTAIFGVGAATAARLERDGYRRLADLQAADESLLMRRYGPGGARLRRLAWGVDDRRVDPSGRRKSISSETTFDVDKRGLDVLEGVLWRLCERVADQLKAAELSAATVVLKLKTDAFRLVTRRRSLDAPVALADPLFRSAAPLLAAALEEPALRAARFRLIGVGAAGLAPASAAPTPAGDLFDPSAAKRAVAETAMDAIRRRFGKDAIGKGRGWP